MGRVQRRRMRDGQGQAWQQCPCSLPCRLHRHWLWYRKPLQALEREERVRADQPSWKRMSRRCWVRSRRSDDLGALLQVSLSLPRHFRDLRQISETPHHVSFMTLSSVNQGSARAILVQVLTLRVRLFSALEKIRL